MSIRIKICGVTSPQDAVHAAELGADAVGLNFHAASVRSVSPGTAAEILRALPPFVESVGVFVEWTWSAILETIEPLCGMSCVQYHGRLPADFAPPSLRFIPAFAIADQSSLDSIAQYVNRCRAQAQMPSAVLVDAQVPGQHGGTGRQAPWQLLAGFQPGVPLILAGGLTPDNVAEAIRTVHPWAVDVASGVESQPGRKDMDKMKRFIENARNAAV